MRHHEGMTEQSLAPGESSDYADESSAERVAIMVYAAITLLGVIAASSLKQFATDEPELIAAAVGASLAVALAHGWAAIMAHRLVHRSMMSRKEILAQVAIAGNLLAVTAIAVGTIAGGQVIGLEFPETVLLVQSVLIALLFLIGFFGSRWAGASWTRALGWGVLDAGIGIGILLVKILVGG